jgi:hypothetical protein
MSVPEYPPVRRDVTVQVSPRVQTLLRIKSLVWLLIVVPVLFLISLVGMIIATAAKMGAAAAYQAVDFDDSKYDRIYAAYQDSMTTVEWWTMLYNLTVPLLAVTLLALVIAEIATKMRRTD